MCRSATAFLLTMMLLGLPIMSHAQPRLSLGSVTVQAGGQAALPLSLSGGTGKYSGVNAQIELPKGVRLVSITRGPLLSPAFFLNVSPTSAKMIAYASTDVFRAANGVLLHLHLHVDASVAQGSYPVRFAKPGNDPFFNVKHALSNADGTISLNHATANGTLVVSPPPPPVSVTASVASGGGGTVTGGGSSVAHNAQVTLKAVPNPGWAFRHWTENGQVVSGAGATYTFPATSNRQLVAHFMEIKSLPGVLMLLLDN